MNPNSKKPGYLFFTPRTPWGTRAGQQSFRQHQRASEDARADADEKHLLWGKEQQGLGAQMATDKSQWRNGAERTLDKQGVPRNLSGQAAPGMSKTPQGLAGQIPPPDSQMPPLQPPQPERPSYRKVTVRPPGMTDDEVKRMEAETIAKNMALQKEKLRQQTGSDGYRSQTWDQRNRQRSAFPPPAPEQGWHGYAGFGYKGQHPGGEDAPERSWRVGITNDPKADGAPDDDLESIEGQKKKQGLKRE